MTAGNIESSNENSGKRVSLCVGCGNVIYDQYILRVSPDLEWHAHCLKCVDCNIQLDENTTCFVRDGKTYCKRDYVTSFGVKCFKCSNGFNKTDFVMRAKSKIFHLECFRCIACSRQLAPGDEFSLRDDEILCTADHGFFDSSSPHDMDYDTCSKTSSLDNLSIKSESDAEIKHSVINDDHNIKSGKASSNNRDSKPTRVRTVMNEKQLHTLRSCYSANPRPDALMKEQLTEMTGLSQRVIRVWFQNKRCKDKKKQIYLKQMHQQQEKEGSLQRPLNGIPMVAASPVPNDPSVQANPVEVTRFNSHWKHHPEFPPHQSNAHFPPMGFGGPPERDHPNFNIMESMYHNQFDSFKKSETLLNDSGFEGDSPTPSEDSLHQEDLNLSSMHSDFYNPSSELQML